MELHLPTIAPEALFHVFGLPITNTMINVWVALVILLIFGLFISRSTKLRPGKVQNVCEYFLDLLLGYFDQVTGDRKKTMRFLPIVGSVFFFILLSNWLGLIPGTGSITIGHEPLFRSANTDMNLTVAMALVAVLSSHIFGFISVGVFTHLGKFIQLEAFFKSFKHGPIAVFTALVNILVGLIEIVSEMSKVVSLSLRLFGNVFAGEVLMTVMASLVGVLVPTPFMLLELLVGLVQASVFSMLTLVYLSIAVEAPHGADDHH